jgi:hypothetical protein
LPLLRRMLGLGITPQQCVDLELTNGIAALIAWGRKVRQNSDWDHKPKIASRFNSCVPGQQQHWHLYGKTLVTAQPSGSGDRGLPAKTLLRAAKTLRPCFLTVEIYPRMRQKALAPPFDRKQPETFC